MDMQVPTDWWQGAIDRGLLFPKEVEDYRGDDGGI